jgi:hypothetical protein
MANATWFAGVVLQFNGASLVGAFKVSTDAAGLDLQSRLATANPTHFVVYIQGPCA